ncbi:hypothetical protein FGF66_06705 [Chlorobaculum thiosulfatiphilum]|uniref:Uncharacterized protein n=2 Tax=Chlorobaculum thiosulfatiphilum TaxID=115852 RepID=A0A5C4S608_CHLTI|nr:hypothetical protein FGF66_06705 [Chlorobaculum thiosulfatiphilum]
MSYDQIRGAFDRTATLAEQARRFIANRRQNILNGETPVPLRSGPKLVVHLVPIAGLAGRMSVDLKPIYDRSYADYFKIVGGGNRVFNLDGLVVHSDAWKEDGYKAYNQIFRNGIHEGVILGSDVLETSQKLIHESSIDYPLYKSAKLFVEKVQSWGFAGPAILGLGILNVKGFELSINKSIGDPFRTPSVADRPNLVLPEEWIDDLNTVDIEGTVRPLLDTLWQAFGIERCPYFDDVTGKFAPRQR